YRIKGISNILISNLPTLKNNRFIILSLIKYSNLNLLIINKSIMKLTKSQRQALKEKYQGRCAYCGDLLGDRWHADHIEPIVRNWTNGTCEHPERNTIENFNPSCPSCNIVKSSLSLENFRKIIGGFITSLN